MQRLVTAEYYKLWKNKGIYTIFALSCMPILFGLLVSLKLNGLTISEGAFDLISFPNNMWQFFYRYIFANHYLVLSISLFRSRVEKWDADLSTYSYS